MFLLATLMLSLSVGIVFAPKISSERFLGYNLQKGKWTTGNLGKDYHEGDFVSYQLWIDETSKIWGNEFSISFNFFQASSGAVYVDGFDTSAVTGFQYTKNGAFLPDGTQVPGGWDPIPTPDAGGVAAPGDPTIEDYMEPWPPGTDEAAGATPAKEHYFTVTNLDWPNTPDIDHIILFFRAHLALDIIWFDAKESFLPQSLDGDMFETWTAAWRGASFATGSSRHFTLHYEGVGDKTIPIPIAQYPTAFVSGYKYVRYCDGVNWVTAKADGWEITLAGTILGDIPYSKTVVTGTSPWETGYFEFNGLIAGDYTLTEENRPGYTPDPPGLSVDFSLQKDGTFAHDFTNQGPEPT